MKKFAIAASVALMTQTLFTLGMVPPDLVLTPALAKSAEADTITEETIGGKNYSVCRTVVHAKPEAVWQVLTDYGNAPHVFPMLKKCQVLEDHGCVKVVKHRITPSGPIGTYEYTVQIKEVPCKVMEWHRVAGDFKEVDGVWKLEPLEAGHATLVTYSSHVNGGMFLPQMMIRRQFRIDSPQVMASLRKQAEKETTQIAGRPSGGSQTQ